MYWNLVTPFLYLSFNYATLGYLKNQHYDNRYQTQVIIIWCITAIATTSTISGISMGIRRLSEVAFIMGLFIMTLVLFLDNTPYLLNLFVQSIGVYIQNIIQLGWHTDAFEQLGPSHGNIQRNRYVPETFETTDGPKDWMDSWTFFYWGWWISFTPFCCKYIS